MAITSLDAIKKQAQPKEITLPGWEEGETITVLAKRPSIFMLASTGKIPNGLLNTAKKMFTNEVDPDVDFKDIAKVMESIAGSALVKPTLKELYDANITLTDDQMASLFSFAQGGIKELERFRTDESSNEGDKPLDDLPKETIGNS